MSARHLATTPGRDRRYTERTLVVLAGSRYTALERARDRMASQGMIVHPYQGRAVETGDGVYTATVRVARPPAFDDRHSAGPTGVR